MSASAGAPTPAQPPAGSAPAPALPPAQPLALPAQLLTPSPIPAQSQSLAPPAQPLAPPPILPPTYVFDQDLDHILTALVDLDLSGPNNLNVEMLQYQGVTSFYQFEVVCPRDFASFTYLIPGGTIPNQHQIPLLIH